MSGTAIQAYNYRGGSDLIEKYPETLEERLVHFIMWLESKGIILWNTNTDQIEGDMFELVDGYVNS
jgi:hypothetical protein